MKLAATIDMQVYKKMAGGCMRHMVVVWRLVGRDVKARVLLCRET